MDSRNVNVIDLRGQLAFAPTAMTMNGGTFSTTFRVGADGTFANGDDETTVRGLAGLDMAYVTDGGSRYFLGAEAGYDTSDIFTGEAKAGLEIPL